MFIATLFIIAKKWKQSKCPSIMNERDEVLTDTCYNMDEPWKHYIKWKKACYKSPYIV